MDERSVQHRPAGGTVEPIRRAAVAKETFQTPPPPPTRRYELRDPFAEVTYRTTTRAEMIAKAEQLGALRFTEIRADGQRDAVVRQGGRWATSAERTTMKTRDPTDRPAAAAPTVHVPERVLGRIDAEADRRARVQSLEAGLHERYLIRRPTLKIGAVAIGQTEYRHRGDTSRVAFTESTFKLSTDTNSPSVARSMVDVAESRHWQGLRVSGNDDFRRMVWLEASLRGVKTIGYEPLPADREALRKASSARQANHVERLAGDPASGESATPKQSARGNGGRKAVLVALEALLVERKVPERQRAAVMAAAADNLAQRQGRGETHRIKIYDPNAATQRSQPAPTREAQRTRERVAPAR